MRHFLLLLLVFLTSCTTIKKSTTSKITDLRSRVDSLTQLKQKIRVDSVMIYRDRVIVDEIETEIMVPIDVDTLGIIRNFNFNASTGAGSATISIRNNKLFIKIKMDSVVQHFEKQYRSKYEKDSISLVKSIRESIQKSTATDSDVVKIKKPWVIYAAGIVIILAVLYFFFVKRFAQGRV